MVSLGAGRLKTDEGTMAGAAAVKAAALRKSLRVKPFWVFDRDMDLSSRNSFDCIPSDKTYHVKIGVVNVRAPGDFSSMVKRSPCPAHNSGGITAEAE
jgi:hypothetical protein